MLLPGLTGKGLSIPKGKSPSRNLHWLLTTWWLPLLSPFSLAASWVGSPSPGGKAPGQKCNPLKERGAQETLHGQPVSALCQAVKEGAALTLPERLRVGWMAVAGRRQPPNCGARTGATRLMGCHARYAQG